MSLLFVLYRERYLDFEGESSIQMMWFKGFITRLHGIEVREMRFSLPVENGSLLMVVLK